MWNGTLSKTHSKRPSPKVTGMKKNSTGIGRVWNTFWLHDAVSSTVLAGEKGTNAQPRHVVEEDADAECKGSSGKCRRVAQRRVLKCAKLAPASCEKVSRKACVSYQIEGEEA